MVVFGTVGRGCRVEAKLRCCVLIELTSLYRDIVVTFPVPLVEDVPGGPGLCGRLVVGVAVRFLFYLIHSLRPVLVGLGLCPILSCKPLGLVEGKEGP